MSLFKGGREIEELYIGGNEISQLYHGSDLIFENTKYTPGQVLFTDRNVGEHTFSVLSGGYFKCCIVAGGGGQSNATTAPIGVVYWFSGGGGSGSGVEFVCKLRRNVNYSYTVGAKGDDSGTNSTAPSGGNSSFNGYTCYGGEGGGTNNVTSAWGGAGGAIPTLDSSSIVVEILDPVLKAGNNGGTTSSSHNYCGGTSVFYDDMGAGSRDGGMRVEYVGSSYTPISRTLTFNIDVPADITIDGNVVAQGVTTYDATMVFGQTINYEVSATGYTTETGSYTWNTADTTDTLSITLNP